MKTIVMVACLLLTACTTEPQAVREWTAADHAHPPENLIDPTRVPQQERPNLTVGELLWQGRCARCHGPEGRGGAEAAVNFAGLDWQASVDNDQIARTIANGKPPAMPAYGDLLSADQIEALVLHIRQFP